MKEFRVMQFFLNLQEPSRFVVLNGSSLFRQKVVCWMKWSKTFFEICHIFWNYLDNQRSIFQLHILSVRADNRSYRLSAPIWAICRYIGFADKQNAYRYRLSVSADKDPYIGNLSDMLNYIWPLGGWQEFEIGGAKLSNLFGKIFLSRIQLVNFEIY